MRLTIGVDEVGYGSIAGPLVVAAVAFKTGSAPPVLKRVKRKDVPVKDSKRVDAKLLPLFFELIQRECLDYMLIAKKPGEIDAQGIAAARRSAMRAAIQRLLERLDFTREDVDHNAYRVIVDGDVDLGDCHFRYKAQPKADRDVWQVSAASLMAKASQVATMEELHRDFCGDYGWNRNKGYPTAQHLKALTKYGVSKHHRRSYGPVKERL